MSSFRISLDPKKRAAGRFITAVRLELQKALSEEEISGSLNKSRIADRLGIHRSAITRRINGTDGLTLRSLAEMAWAMDRIPEIILRLPHHGSAGSNERHMISDGGGLSPVTITGNGACAVTVNQTPFSKITV